MLPRDWDEVAWRWKVPLPGAGHASPVVADGRTVSSPVVVDGLVIGTCGEGGGDNLLVAVRLPPGAGNADAATAEPEIAYRLDRSVAPTCRRPWGRAAGGAVINVSADGEVVAIADGDAFVELGRPPLGEDSRATPAVAGDRLILRSVGHLFSL